MTGNEVANFIKQAASRSKPSTHFAQNESIKEHDLNFIRQPP